MKATGPAVGTAAGRAIMARYLAWVASGTKEDYDKAFAYARRVGIEEAGLHVAIIGFERFCSKTRPVGAGGVFASLG